MKGGDCCRGGNTRGSVGRSRNIGIKRCGYTENKRVGGGIGGKFRR